MAIELFQEKEQPQMGGAIAPKQVYLAYAIRLALFLGVARIRLEESNNALGREVLLELDDKVSSVGSVVKHLEAARYEIANFKNAIKSLRGSLQEEDFVDTPSVKHLDLTTIGQKMRSFGLVSPDNLLWGDAASAIETFGFYGVLAEYEKRMVGLDKLTEHLLTKVRRVEGRSIVGLLEANEEGNFRGDLANLLVAWNQFEQFFHCVRMIWAEASYRELGTGSLICENVGKQAAA